MRIRTLLPLLLAAGTLGACGTFLLPHPRQAADNSYWFDNWNEGAHVPPGFRDPPPPPPPPPPPKE